MPAGAPLGINIVGAGVGRGQPLTPGHAQAPKLIWEALQHRAKLSAFKHSSTFSVANFGGKKELHFPLTAVVLAKIRCWS